MFSQLLPASAPIHLMIDEFGLIDLWRDFHSNFDRIFTKNTIPVSYDHQWLACFSRSVVVFLLGRACTDLFFSRHVRVSITSRGLLWLSCTCISLLVFVRAALFQASILIHNKTLSLFPFSRDTWGQIFTTLLLISCCNSPIYNASCKYISFKTPPKLLQPILWNILIFKNSTYCSVIKLSKLTRSIPVRIQWQ